MKTKFEIIETPDYILAVADNKIEEGDYMLSHSKTLCRAGNSTLVNMTSIEGTKYKKVIAYQPKNNSPDLDLPLLPEIVIEDDVEKLAEIDVRRVMGHLFCKDDLQTLSRMEIFKRGYKASTKTFSEDDLRKAIEESISWWEAKTHEKYGKINTSHDFADEFIQSIKQFKPKWFVAEMEVCDNCINHQGQHLSPDCCHNYRLKTTKINGKEYLVGTYE